MKTQFQVIHSTALGAFVCSVTRKRAAYLIRAARSRNVLRFFPEAGRYFLSDCSHAIVPLK